MIIEINATEAEVQTMINILTSNPTLGNIISQLEASLVNSDDSQSGEIPEEGDNAVIKRME